MKTEAIAKPVEKKQKLHGDSFVPTQKKPPGSPNGKLTSRLKGGFFLIEDTPPLETFTIEDWTEEQKLFAQAILDFCKKELQDPFFTRGKELDVTDPKDKAEIVNIFKKGAHLGYCGLNIPKEYGGEGLDFRTGLLFNACMVAGYSISTTFGAQNSIGTLPILFYGTNQQREKYLPKIAAGEWITAYALTESHAGSDASAANTKARLSPDGNFYFLSGEKSTISNAGIADVFIVFARIENDEALSAFIIEKNYPGISIGAEENKMGLKASSTASVYLEECMVPKENLLGERGDGVKIALNILNIGRSNLGAAGVGVAKNSLNKAIEYSKKRKQFGRPIGEFGAIKQKIGKLATHLFAFESTVYRVGGNIDQKVIELHKKGRPEHVALVYAAREFAIESSILKARGSELACWASDETIQIHGALGYMVSAGLEMVYRDSRVLKIYEGTNEINKLFMIGELGKRAFRNKELDMKKAIKKLPWHILKRTFDPRPSEDSVCPVSLTHDLKMVFLLIYTSVARAYGKKLKEEQEVLLNLSEILSDVFVAESVLLKFQKLMATKVPYDKKLAVQTAMVQLYAYEMQQNVLKASKDIVYSFATGVQKRFILFLLKRLTRPLHINPTSLRRKVADYVLEQGVFPF